jgi:hypothetical protein
MITLCPARLLQSNVPSTQRTWMCGLKILCSRKNSAAEYRQRAWVRELVVPQKRAAVITRIMSALMDVVAARERLNHARSTADGSKRFHASM